MKTRSNELATHPKSRAAFTLIELLVVIAVIALLASMIFPVMGAVNRAKVRARSAAERAQLETAISSYKSRHGQYPPDNPNDPVRNPLFYELLGTTFTNGVYTTLDGGCSIRQSDLATAFGPNVPGFVNCTRGGGGDETTGAESFLKGLKEVQVKELPAGAGRAKVLAGIDWKVADQPFNVQPINIPGAEGINPWRYNSSKPTNNPNSYDLWIDVNIGGKIYRVCNWNKDMVRVTQ